MKLFFRLSSVVLLSCLAAACASPGRGGPPGGGRHGAGPGGFEQGGGRAGYINRPSQLLTRAREQQAKEGCAKAAPAYRIVSSYGEGYEVAQYELGACLLEMTGASDAETRLFREEAFFWLHRAAYGGDARAQKKLTEALSGAQGYSASHAAADPQAAMMWSLVYASNGARDTYGLKPLSSIVTAHLDQDLSSVAKAEAASAAAAFATIAMEAFIPAALPEGAREERGGRGGPGGGGPGGGEPPRRR